MILGVVIEKSAFKNEALNLCSKIKKAEKHIFHSDLNFLKTYNFFGSIKKYVSNKVVQI